MKILPFISLFCISLLATSCMAAANYVTPEKYQVNEYMNNYYLGDQNNSYELACEIGQYVSETYGWNCDIRRVNFTNHDPVYINAFYPAADNKKGYEAYYGWFGPQRKEVTSFTGKDKRMYYRDWFEPGRECYISGIESYGIVKSYYGNVTEENTTDPVIIIDPVEEPAHNEENLVIQTNSSLSAENSTVKTVIADSVDANNTVENSTNVVNNHGVIDTVKQYWFDFSNTDWSNVSFNFWG